MSTASDGDGGFLTFYRQYAHTSIHTVTATALTAFGLLTFVHQGFVALAIAVYVLPPIYLYLTREEAPEPVDGEEASGADDRERPTAGDTAAATGTGSEDGSAAAGDVGEDRPDRIDESTPDAGPDSGPSDRDSTDPAGPARGGVAEPEPGEARKGAGDAPEATTATGSATTGSETGSPDDGREADPDSGPEPAEPRTGERAEPATSDAAEPEADRGSPPDASEDGTVGDEDFAAAGGTADDTGEDAEDGPAKWAEADSPTEETLLDAVSAGESAYAAGKNGVLLARSGGEEWEVALESGPAAESTTLRGVDATEDGEAIWVAGDGGVLGRYDPSTARHTDHSAPAGITDNWSGLAVAGAAGGERLALVNGSGQVLFGEYDGSEVEWDEPVKPGSGSSMSEIAFIDESTGYCCDTNAGVYRIEGREFERIGIENASGFDALAAVDDAVAVASDDGTVQRFDGSVWTPVRVAESALNGLATDGEEWLAAGAGGALYENRDGDWEPVDSPAEAELFGVAAGEVPVVVGAGGTLLERR